MMKTTILMIVMLFSASMAQAQPSEPTLGKYASVNRSGLTVNAGIGLNALRVRDEYISPYTYGGSLFSACIGFQYDGADTRQTLRLLYNAGELTSDRQTRTANAKGGFLAYTYDLRAGEWHMGDLAFRIFMGGGVTSNVTNIDLLTPPAITWEAAVDQSWLWSHVINLHASGDVAVGRNTAIALALTLPVVRNDSRPAGAHWFSSRNAMVSDNFLRAATRGQMDYVWTDPTVSLDVELRQQLSDDVAVTGRYAFSYASPDDPMPARFLTNQFTAGIEIHLGR